MPGTITFIGEVEVRNVTYRDYARYDRLEPQDFVRIHESDLKALLVAAAFVLGRF